MKKLIQLIIALSFITCSVLADQFQLQLKQPEATDGFDVSYAKVDMPGFSGRTDKLGRIAITGLSNGTYTAEIQDSRGHKNSVSVQILGDQKLRVLQVQ